MSVNQVSSSAVSPGTGSAPAVPCGLADPRALLLLGEQGHAAALEALADPDPFSGYRAIALLSRHLAVTRMVLAPAARRRLGRDHRLATAYAAAAREAERALRLFERWLTGDACAARLPAESVRALLDEHLDRYRAVERALLAALVQAMPLPECERLAGRYSALLATAPTRPHPRRARAGQASLIVFRFHGFRDRVRNTLDSRPGASRLP